MLLSKSRQKPVIKSPSGEGLDFMAQELAQI